MEQQGRVGGPQDAREKSLSGHPRTRADLERVLARAAAGEIRAVLPGVTGEPADTVRIERDAIAGLLVSAMQSVNERAQLPALLREAASGNTARLAALVIQTRRMLDERLFMGMHLSVSCAGDGRWPLEVRYPGEMPVELDEGEGKPSRWNTLRALRVLHWYSAGNERAGLEHENVE